nr:hypothetical protein Iba_chr04fCG14420 [Ipomoea batatas]
MEMEWMSVNEDAIPECRSHNDGHLELSVVSSNIIKQLQEKARNVHGEKMVQEAKETILKEVARKTIEAQAKEETQRVGREDKEKKKLWLMQVIRNYHTLASDGKLNDTKLEVTQVILPKLVAKGSFPFGEILDVNEEVIIRMKFYDRLIEANIQDQALVYPTSINQDTYGVVETKEEGPSTNDDDRDNDDQKNLEAIIHLSRA